MSAAQTPGSSSLVEGLLASRARLIDAATQELLAIERDLHDGAQQRLLTLQIKLALVQDEADQPLAARLGEIAADAEAAADDLRALGQRLYPTALRERGLADGLRSLAGSMPTPVRVVDEDVGRCAPTIEAAVYFCSREALENAMKHAGPRAGVTVTLRGRGSEVEFAIADDGVGFEAESDPVGTGLNRMRDWIGAVGGDLEVVSAPGQGTVVRGTVPDARPG